MGVIIVGVDGSEPSAQAALAAARLASALGSALRVICAFGRSEERTADGRGSEYGEWAFGGRTLDASGLSGATRVAEGAIARIRAFYPRLEVSAHAVSGRPAAALLQAAEQFDAELIVVGNKNVQGASRILGSVAKEVAKRARCDLYVAHTTPRPGV